MTGERLRLWLERGASGYHLRDVVVFSLFRDEYPQTPSAAAVLEAFDAAGARLL